MYICIYISIYVYIYKFVPYRYYHHLYPPQQPRPSSSHTHTPVVNGPEKHILNRVDTRMRVALIMYLMKEFFL